MVGWDDVWRERGGVEGGGQPRCGRIWWAKTGRKRNLRAQADRHRDGATTCHTTRELDRADNDAARWPACGAKWVVSQLPPSTRRQARTYFGGHERRMYSTHSGRHTRDSDTHALCRGKRPPTTPVRAHSPDITPIGARARPHGGAGRGEHKSPRNGRTLVGAYRPH